MTKATDIHFC